MILGSYGALFEDNPCTLNVAALVQEHAKGLRQIPPVRIQSNSETDTIPLASCISQTDTFLIKKQTRSLLLLVYHTLVVLCCSAAVIWCSSIKHGHARR